ncbi:MAG TPA: helix-turn-helix transcriptional regulator [Candidatus Kapabacteria bacterium]
MCYRPYMLWRIYALIFILLSFLTISNQVGQNIRKFRLLLSMSQETLAELSDLHPSLIGRLERGTVNVSLWSLDAIAKALKMKPYELLKD